jgi:eukaryotic-like serine/threonine-protein kinase
MGFEIGKTYSGYEFLDILKRSKNEIAYRVRNTLAQRIEVLRILSGGFQDDQEQMERFLREIKVHAKLIHPNIVTFYNALELERQVVMTTELVEGVTLAERLELGPMPPDDAIGFFSQALSALAYAHARQIVHRDITPEHMLITPEGILKLSHFGLAKSPTSPQLTQNGAVLGNLKYIPPEQVRGKGNLDPRSDLYSLGVALYEALVGKPPFESKSQFELMLAHVSEIPKPPSTVGAGVPAALDAPVLKALGKNPADRFQTADEFRQSLEAVRAGLKPASIPETSPDEVSEASGKPTEAVAVAAAATGGTGVAITASAKAELETAGVPEAVQVLEPAGGKSLAEAPAPPPVAEPDAAPRALFATSTPAPVAQLMVIGFAAAAIAALVLIAYLVTAK